MSKDEVRSLLGEPLKTWPTSDGEKVWAFTRAPQKGNYHVRIIDFDRNGTVKKSVVEEPPPKGGVRPQPECVVAATALVS